MLVVRLSERGNSMAYLDLDNAFSVPQGARILSSADEAPAGFSALEWSVIALAKHDSMRSLAEPGRLSRAIGGLFGLGTSSHLADPRLEALRRLSVYAWRRGFALPQSEIDRFLSADFVEAQIELLVESVTGLRVGVSGTMQV